MKIVLRQLLQSPGFTVIALITLALGIGVNTTTFTVLNRLLFFEQPFHEPDGLVQIWSTTPQWMNGPISSGDFVDIQEQNSVFEHSALFYVNYQKSIAKPGQPAERSIAMAVTADFFATLGIPAAVGRTFTVQDESAGEFLLVLSHAYWQKHFAGDPNVVGTTLRFDGNAFTVAGVMPPVLDDPQIWNGRVDLWHLESLQMYPFKRQERTQAWHSMIGRLKPGATVEQAHAEVMGIGARLAKDFPASNEHRSFRAAPYAPDYMGELGRNITWMVMGLALAVLMIACVNLANLQLVRTTARAREHGIRLALGASRGKLVRMFLMESLLLSLAGGALALLVAKWSNSYYATYFDSPMPMDYRVLAFALVASMATGVAFGAIPAWIGSKADVNAILKLSGRGSTADRTRHRLRHGLIVFEIAIALTLLTGAGYFIRGIQRISDRELHWRPENVLIGSFELPYLHYGDETNARHELFNDKFLAALRLLPGVDHVALSGGSPVWGPTGGLGVLREGQTPPPPGQEQVATFNAVGREFLDTYGIQLLQGRSFNDDDRPQSPRVAIINQAMAEKFWPGENPVGQRFSGGDPRAPESFEIVGVMANFVAGGDFVGQYPRYHFFRSWTQRSSRFVDFSLHSTWNAGALSDGVRKALASIEPDVAITRLLTAEQALNANVSAFSLVRRTLTQLAALGLLLSIVGIYGVIANLTVERTHEVGIRMALGAQRGDVIWLFLRNGLLLAVVGTGVGLVSSFGLVHLLNRTMMIIPGNDPWVVAGLSILLIAVAVIACWSPARRATRVNPIVALRIE